MENFISSLLPRLENLGSLVYWVIFLIGILESLPIISIIIPSSIILIGIGFFATEGTLHVTDLIWSASLGAVLGDSIGYYLGKYKNNKISKLTNKFFSPEYIKKTDKYFESHGGKSIFVGRFIGMMRPFLSFVAGMHHMKYSRFLFFNITSAFLWSALYILLGYYFGEHLKRILLWLNVSNYILIGLVVVIPVALFFWKKLRKGTIINPL